MAIQRLMLFFLFGFFIRVEAAVPAVQVIKSTFAAIPYTIKLYDVIPYFKRLKRYEQPTESQRPENTVFAFEKDGKKIRYAYSKKYAGIISRGIARDSIGILADLAFIRTLTFKPESLGIDRFQGLNGKNAYLVPHIFVSHKDYPDVVNINRLNLWDQFSRLVDDYVLSYGFAETIAHEDRVTGLFSQDSLHTQVSIMGSVEMVINQDNFVSYGFFQYTFNEYGELYHRAFKPFSLKNLYMLSSGVGHQPIFGMLGELFLNNILKKKSSYSSLEREFYNILSKEALLAENAKYADYSLGYQLRKFFDI